MFDAVNSVTKSNILTIITSGQSEILNDRWAIKIDSHQVNKIFDAANSTIKLKILEVQFWLMVGDFKWELSSQDIQSSWISHQVRDLGSLLPNKAVEGMEGRAEGGCKGPLYHLILNLRV